MSPQKKQKNKSLQMTTIILAVVIIASFTIYAYTTFIPNAPNYKQPNNTNDIIIDEDTILLTVTFRNQTYPYTLTNLESHDSFTGIGQYINKAGSLSDMNNYTGVTIPTLLKNLENLSENYTISAIADDGYTIQYSYEEINGLSMTYNQTRGELGTKNVTMIIAYLENNKPISNETDGPLIIAFVNKEGSITSSGKWIRFLEQIIIHEN